MQSAKISKCDVSVRTYPTDRPESDGTLEWDSTTMVIAELTAGQTVGRGYTYSGPSVATLIREQLRPLLLDQDPLDIPARVASMTHAIRNLGRPGVASMAISAVDIALWDLKAKLLGQSIVSLLGRARDCVPVYGSGGFTSYRDEELIAQTAGWANDGIKWVKIKVGRQPERDRHRAEIVKKAIGPAELFVDANGAYDRKQAIAFAHDYAQIGVTWFEEPVSSDDLDGLRLIRDANVPAIEIAAGEYGFHSDYFLRMMSAGAVDVLQADATRCGGVTGFLQTAALAQAFHIPLSSHCAPSIHAHLGCVVPGLRHIEYFHDHARIEKACFDGFLSPVGGILAPHRDWPGFGWQWKPC